MGDETLVAYSASTEALAADGERRNSPFTTALLAYLEELGMEVGLLFRRVGARVLAETERRQRPWVYGSLFREHYLSVADPGCWRGGEVFRAWVPSAVPGADTRGRLCPR